MLGTSEASASFSVNNIDAAKRFNGDTLGLDVAGGSDDRGPPWLRVAGRRSVLIYPQPDHTPAAFTVLNVMVDDIERTVEDLVTRGVRIDTFDAYESDAGGIHRAGGHSVAWFHDPAGNVVSIGQEH